MADYTPTRIYPLDPISQALDSRPSETWDLLWDDSARADRASELWPAPVVIAPELLYVNRVWDTSIAAFVRWETSALPDSTGASYPGPGVWPGDIEDYCYETRRMVTP